MRSPVALGWLGGVLVLAGGCGSENHALTIGQAGHVGVFEGLPHPGYEGDVFEREEAKPTVKVGGSSFYRDPLNVSEADRAALVIILRDRASYSSYSGEKKCGGFHADYALEWTHEGKTYWALICFGCTEIKIGEPWGEQTYDMAEGVSRRLKAVLKPYRKNRPVPQSGSPLYFSDY